MGNRNSSPFTINVNRDNLFYFTDEIVSGTVSLNVIKEKLEVNGINVVLIGEVGYTTTESTTDSFGNLITEIKYQKIPFYVNKIPFVIPELWQKRTTLNQGEYSWPFHLPLAKNLPPTISHPQSYPHVAYYLQVMIDKPWYKRDQWGRKHIIVYPHVNLLDNYQYLTSTTFDKQNRKQIKLTGTLNKSGYIPGETIDISFTIENPQQVLIKHVNLSLIQLARLGGDMRMFTLFQTTLPNMSNIKDELIKQPVAVMIPPCSIPPSYKFHEENQTDDIVDISYLIKFEVKVTGMFTDFDVDIPFTMGTESKSWSGEKSMFNGDTDSPPSYDFVQNMK